MSRESDDRAAAQAVERVESTREWLAEYMGYPNLPRRQRAGFEADLDKWTRMRRRNRSQRQQKVVTMGE